MLFIALFEEGSARYEYYVNRGGLTLLRAVENGQAQWFEVVDLHLDIHPVTDWNEANRILAKTLACAGTRENIISTIGTLLTPDMTRIICNYLIPRPSDIEVVGFLSHVRNKIIEPRCDGKIIHTKIARSHDSLCFHIDCGIAYVDGMKYYLEYCPCTGHVYIVTEGSWGSYFGHPADQVIIHFMTGIPPPRKLKQFFTDYLQCSSLVRPLL